MAFSNRSARIGAGFYILWGLVHVVGAAFQLSTLSEAGGVGLTALVSTGHTFDPGAVAQFPAAAEAYMRMGALNLLWIGLFITVVGATLNWRNSPIGYWVSLAVAGGTDLALLAALLLPGYLAWGDGAIGLTLYVLALIFSTLGWREGGRGTAGQGA